MAESILAQEMTTRFALTDRHIRRALDELSQDHAPIQVALSQVGYPASRRRDHSFESLARIIIGQQLSTKAAATITTRVEAPRGTELTPSSVLSLVPRRVARGRIIAAKNSVSASAVRGSDFQCPAAKGATSLER